MCNKYIKFDLFKKEAEKLGADYIATGHYAKTMNNKLYKAFDENKDQTYFLAQVNKKDLTNVLFPIGHLDKTEVRKIADELGLITAKKKDSTGICFIGERNYQKFVSNYLKPNPGDIVDIDTNEIIGKHTGLMNYTIGQRRNVGISGNLQRHFVVGKNVKDNILYVAFGDDNEYLYSTSCLIDNLNFISDERPINCTAKFRYRGEEYDVELEYLNDEVLVKYPQKVKAVTPGQACVLYLENECIGSGIIKTVMKNDKILEYLNPQLDN